MDTGTRAELLAANLTVDEIRDYLGLDSIAYLEIERLIDSTGTPASGFCSACLSGEYPVAIPDEVGRDVLGERVDEIGGAFVAAPTLGGQG